jgi:hypothetical protein
MFASAKLIERTETLLSDMKVKKEIFVWDCL